jgi:hypothetical protein
LEEEAKLVMVVDLTFLADDARAQALEGLDTSEGLEQGESESSDAFVARRDKVAADAEELKVLLELYTVSIASDDAPTADVLESLKPIIEARVNILYNLLNGPDSGAASDEQRAAYDVIQAAHDAADASALTWVQKIQKSQLAFLINAAVDRDVVVSSIDDLKFEVRRDDQKFNLFLDLEKTDDETVDEFAEKKARLEEEAIYKPSLWVSYDNEMDNLKTQGTDPALKYINIPYEFKFEKDADSDSTTKAKQDLEAVMLALRDKTCINFTEVKDYTKLGGNEQQYIKFVNDQKRGCDEIIGRKDPKDVDYNHEVPQLQPFSDICQNNQDDSQNGQSTMGHYLMHILGFDNEHQRPDVKESGMVVRDDFTGVAGSEVAKKVPKLMERAGHNDLKALTDNASQLSGQPYDKMSIMHWSNSFIGDEADSKIPHMRKGEATPFSATDLEKIKALYKCAPRELDLMEDLKCHFILNEDGSVIVPLQCLIEEGDVAANEPEYKGEAHVFVKSQPMKLAKVTLNYDIQEKSEALEAPDAVAPVVEEVPVVGVEAPVVEVPVVEAPLIEERRLADGASEAAPVAEVEAAPVAEVEAAPVAEVEAAPEKSYAVTAAKFEEEGASEAAFPAEDPSMCVVAKLAYEGESENSGVLCGNETAMEVNGECEKDVKFSYKLDSTDLGNKLLNKTPGLTVNVTYEDCEPNEAALVDESSASTITLTTVFLALF